MSSFHWFSYEFQTPGQNQKPPTSNIRHKDFRANSFRHAQGTPPLDSETGWTGELWSKKGCTSKSKAA